MFISIVIPTLNEAERIQGTIDSVYRQTLPVDTQIEIIVVDGGSTDATLDLPPSSVRILLSPPGRARQMNLGAAAACGDLLLFLHADTRLPSGALERIPEIFCDPAVIAGIFQIGFDRPTFLLDFYSWCTRLSTWAVCFGDRALSVRTSAFRALGGYGDLPLFEDVDLARRLAQRGKIQFLSEAVETSARRFERYGPIKQQLRNTLLWIAYLAGLPPHVLARTYRYK